MNAISLQQIIFEFQGLAWGLQGNVCCPSTNSTPLSCDRKGAPPHSPLQPLPQVPDHLL